MNPKVKMPSFKTLKEAEQYGIKNYFTPKIKETIRGNWNVRDEWDNKKKV